MPEKFTNLAVDCSFFRFHCGGEPMMTEGPGLFYYISTRGIGFDRAAITSVLWYGASSLDAPSCVVAVAWLKGTARPELRNMPGQLTAHCSELGWSQLRSDHHQRWAMGSFVVNGSAAGVIGNSATANTGYQASDVCGRSRNQGATLAS